MPTISSNAYYDVACSTGGYITITNGATLTVRKSTTSSNRPSAITIEDGTLLFDPTVTGGEAPIVFMSNSNDHEIKFSGKIKANGAWTVIGTGDGSASQEIAFYGGAYSTCNFCQVETGNGTDEWIDFFNVGYNQALTGIHPTDLSKGCFFQMSGTTTRSLKFGDGVNGVVLPVGARVRVPNIYMGRNAGSAEDSGSTRYTIWAHDGAQVDLNKMLFSHSWVFNCANTQSVKLYDVGVSGNYHRLDSPGVVDIDGFLISWASNSSYTPVRLFNAADATITRLQVTSLAKPLTWTIQACNNITFNNTKLLYYPSNLTLWDNGITFETCKNLTFNNTHTSVDFSSDAASSDFKINNFYSCSHPTQQNTNGNRYIIQTLGSGTKINGLYNWGSDGTAANNFLKFSGADNSFTNIDWDQRGYGAGYMFLHTTRPTNITIARVNLGDVGTRTLLYTQASPLIISGKFFNIKWTGAGNAKFFSDDILGLKDITLKNVIYTNGVPYAGTAAAGAGYGIGGTSDMAIHVANNTDLTTGNITFIANPPNNQSYYEVLAGAPYFTQQNGIYLETNGNSVRFTTPYPIYGLSSFINSAPSVVASAHFTSGDHIKVSYKIEGGEWSGDYGINTQWATLAGLTFDPAVGIYVRVKITATSSIDNNIFRRINLPINVDANALYPLAFTSIKLDNIVSGSTYYIFRNSDNSVVASGTASGTSVDITGIAYSSDQAITVRVRKPGYKVFETGGTITSTASSIWISQESDAAVYLAE